MKRKASLIAALFALAAAVSPAVALDASPGQLAAAREVVIASGMSKSFGAVIPQFMDQITQRMTQTRPELITDMALVMKDLRPDFERQADVMLDLASRIYSAQLSEQELKDTAAFFKSPVGVKYVSAQPPILDQLVVAMQGWTQKISTDMVTRVREAMKKKGHEL